MLAQLGWGRVDVFDELPAPPPPSDPAWGAGNRSYQLGLNGRGQKALSGLGCMERIDRYSAFVRGRLTFDKDGAPVQTLLKPPGTPGAEKSYVTRVLQRDRLQACLLEEIAERYPQVHVQHCVQCEGLELAGDRPVLRLRGHDGAAFQHCPVDLVVGADGVRSAVRDALVDAPGSRTRFVSFPDNNERRYKTFVMHPGSVPGTGADLNWGASNSSLGLNMDALPTKEGQMVGVMLFRPGSEVYRRIEGIASAADARRLFEDALPQLLPYLDEPELACFAARPIGRLPSFHTVEGEIHRQLPRGAVVMLGDSIKAVKPYFGQGCNSALEDVSALRACLEEAGGCSPEAAALFSHRRGEEARALVRISRGFDAPGRLGTLRFVLPLIVDSLLHRALPRAFGPPLLRALQDERRGFAELERGKLRERCVQVGLCVAFVALVRRGIGLLLRAG